MSARNKIFAAFATMLVITAFAAPVSQDDAGKAAAAFIADDAIGSAILGGRTVDGIQKRDQLWIVALLPSGHIILSASDLATPIVGFSENNFTEPDPESPAYTVLQGTSDKIRSLEESAATERDPKWDALLAPISSRKLLGAPSTDSPGTVVIKPFMTCSYNQWQPYNDFAPIYETDDNNLPYGKAPYRGRCPCGCVATAAAQELRHFRWPVRIDRVDSFDHSFTDAKSVTKSFPLRFDGHLPIDWNSLNDNYTDFYGDLRGKVPEATRFPIARLILWMDVLAKMKFASSSSSANYGTVASNISDWYTPGTWVEPTDERVLSDITSGIPLQVTIPGHAVICHGWATTGNTKYMYINYGWGGDENDGYYDISSGTIQNVYVGHYPRAKPQLDPLPKVCETSLTLNWHFQDFYTNKLSGFTVSAQKMGTVPTTFSDDFSNSSGLSSTPDEIYIGTDSDYNLDGNLLCANHSAAGNWTFPSAYTLTSASVLTFKILSFAALGMSCEIQAKTTHGDWQTICTPRLKTDWGSSGWSTERVYLGGMGGQSVNLRVKFSRNSSYYFDAGRVLIDDFQVTQVLSPGQPQTYTVNDKRARSQTLSDLTAGADYSFTVTPIISGALVNGETSTSITVAIEGPHRTYLPGEQTNVTEDLLYSTKNSTWSINGTNPTDTSITVPNKYPWGCSFSCSIYGELTADSNLLFDWTAAGLYDTDKAYDIITVEFIENNGTSTLLHSLINSAKQPSARNFSLSLADLAGKSGTISVSFVHEGNQSAYTDGITFYSPKITNVLVPHPPVEASYQSQTITALGMPKILKVSPAAEGFYRGCDVSTTTFTVKCSEHVTALTAHSSHPSLLKDEDITFAESSNKGEWTLAITPSGVNESNYRSRMILTLEATDSNGTKAYKDLSLRFDKVEEEIPEGSGDDEPVVVTIDESGDNPMTVSILAEWFDRYWPGQTDRSALVEDNIDSDKDGIPNWQEYICGTNPTNAEEKAVIECSMTFVNGGVIVTLPEDDRQIPKTFTKKIKGSNNLHDWWPVEPGTTTSKHFFKVVIEPTEE